MKLPHASKTEIADFLQKLDLTQKIIILSSDAHLLAVDDGTNSNYATNSQPGERGFPAIHAAPLDW